MARIFEINKYAADLFAKAFNGKDYFDCMGGAAVGPGGLWKAAGVEEVVRSEGKFKARIPAASVALIALHG